MRTLRPDGRPHPRLNDIRRRVLRHKRLLAAIMLTISASLLVYQLTPEPAQREAVVAASSDLPVGTTLSRENLTLIQLPAQAITPGAFREVDRLVGRSLATPLKRGQPLSDVSLLGPGLLSGTAPGTSAVPVRLADPQSLKVLSPGQLVDIVLSQDGEAGSRGTSTVVASRLAVLWLGKDGSSDGWLGTGDAEGLLVLAASPSQAQSLAGAGIGGKLSFVLVR
ncbi:Flp pilus assembly protein CpaB [Arthrobacter sp. NPDC090010]|uniref:Flp pilus assembly protein CpaB n=1 Tax=Arthrobacter sp. NPDC090010 TaxID=3363942 RepID=UPI003824526C